MVRIFTTSFHFNHEVYDAIVTIVNKGDKADITVKVMDIALQELLPGGKISFSGNANPADHLPAVNAMTESLLKSISIAVERHLVS